MKNMPGTAQDSMDDVYGESQPKPDPQASVDEQEAQEMAQKAVVPTKVLMGPGQSPLKEGDEVVVKVLGIHGEDAEIAYSKTKPGEVGGEEPAGGDMSPDDELDSLSKEY